MIASATQPLVPSSYAGFGQSTGTLGLPKSPAGQFKFTPQLSAIYSSGLPAGSVPAPASMAISGSVPAPASMAISPTVPLLATSARSVYSFRQCPLSPNAMAKLKEFTTDHHWGPRSKDFQPVFDEAGDGAEGLNYEQMEKFYADTGTKFFGESLAHLLAPDIFERFDFNGDGTLDFYQAKRSFKCILYEVFHEFGGETIKPIEFKTPAEMGYTIIKELARGGQGAAILAKSADGEEVVLKTYDKSNPNAGSIEEHIAEMEVLRELQYESNVMHAYDIFQDAKCVYCVNELLAGGDLESLRERAEANDIPLTQEYFQNIFKQTLLGVEHIHDHGLMHCDIKEPNIMLKTTDLENPQVAIIDFGLAHVCAGPGEAGGTPGYIPPETNTRHVWYPKGDIFSLGVTFFQLLADKTPNEKLGKMGVFQEGCRTLEDVVLFTATRELPLHLIARKYPGVMSWLPKMCSKVKKPRPRAPQLLELPFFSAKKGSASFFGCCAEPEVSDDYDEITVQVSGEEA